MPAGRPLRQRRERLPERHQRVELRAQQQRPADRGHLVPGNSLFEDKGGPAANATTWFRARSNVTSYGTHNVFSGGEVTTSGATPFMASVLAMTQSAALNAVDGHRIGSRLTPNEIKQVLMDTAQPVIPQTQSPTTSQQWPGNPNSLTDADHHNWSTQYGYGRPDVGAATKMIMAGENPPPPPPHTPPTLHPLQSAP